MRILITIGFLTVLLLQFTAAPGMAYNSGKAADCSTYARNRADSEYPSGGGAIGGAARGAAGGALFGAVVGGSKGAGRGAALGAGMGMLGGGARAAHDRESRYRYYYDSCMRGM